MSDEFESSSSSSNAVMLLRVLGGLARFDDRYPDFDEDPDGGGVEGSVFARGSWFLVALLDVEEVDARLVEEEEVGRTSHRTSFAQSSSL